MQASIAVDASPSSVSIRAQTDAGPLFATSSGVQPSRRMAPQWASAITGFLDAHPDLEVEEVSLSANPIYAESAHNLMPLLAPRGIHRVAVGHHLVALFLGALGDRPGVVVKAGVGAMCLAVGRREVARVDGWGPLFGNAGSAFWIGRTAIEAALRGYDGRRQLTALTDMVRADFPDLERAHFELQLDPDWIVRVASYAKRVDELSATDRVSANILDKAAAHLSEAVQAGIRKAGLAHPDCPPVVASGSVFSSERVKARFCDYLTLQWPNFALIEPADDVLTGTARFLSLPTGHPLYHRISFAQHG